MKKRIKFTKMVGAGNDFIMIDAPERNFNLKNFTKKVCNRTNGIGADGVITVAKSRKQDYKMRIINADGSEAEMCGNGARCFAAYVVKNLKPKSKRFSIKTLAGEILGEAKGEEAIVRLSDPVDYKANIPIVVNNRQLSLSYIDTGVPHVIIFVHDLAEMDVSAIGENIRYHETFRPRGTNVNFVEPISKNLIASRTYERGVENETKACGTGSVAAALVAYLNANPEIQKKSNAKMRVRTQGGEILQITFDIKNGLPTNVWLKGSARFIAKGECYV